MKPREYSSAHTFKQALEQRLRTAAGTGISPARKRQLLVFERFLARIASSFGETMVLKGGLVLELRLERARTTMDVDLRMTGSPEDLLARLQKTGALDLGDYLTFEIRPDGDHPQIRNDGMQYDGFRFRASCLLAGKIYDVEPHRMEMAAEVAPDASRGNPR